MTIAIIGITANTNGTKITGTVVDNANNSNTCTITIKADINGETKKIHICSKCLRSGKIKRAQFKFYK